MAGSGSGEVSPHGFEIAIFSLYPYVEEGTGNLPGVSLKGHFSIMRVELHELLNSRRTYLPNIIALGLMLQHESFGETQAFSP